MSGFLTEWSAIAQMNVEELMFIYNVPLVTLVEDDRYWIMTGGDMVVGQGSTLDAAVESANNFLRNVGNRSWLRRKLAGYDVEANHAVSPTGDALERLKG